MPVPRPRYSKEEFARRGDEIYDRDISPHIGFDDEGKFVVIDIETGAYEIDQDELAASDRLLARRLDAQMWTRRVGSRYARRLLRRLCKQCLRNSQPFLPLPFASKATRIYAEIGTGRRATGLPISHLPRQ